MPICVGVNPHKSTTEVSFSNRWVGVVKSGGLGGFGGFGGVWRGLEGFCFGFFFLSFLNCSSLRITLWLQNIAELGFICTYEIHTYVLLNL